jgi:hypothetical protein
VIYYIFQDLKKNKIKYILEFYPLSHWCLECQNHVKPLEYPIRTSHGRKKKCHRSDHDGQLLAIIRCFQTSIWGRWREARRARDKEGHPTSRRGDRDERRREARWLCVDASVSRRRREAGVGSGSASEIQIKGDSWVRRGVRASRGVLFNWFWSRGTGVFEDSVIQAKKNERSHWREHTTFEYWIRDVKF